MKWETFRDASYYDMWCVRPAGQRHFGYGFHLVNGDEAKGLCELLEGLEAEIKRLREAGTALAGYAGHDSECEDVTGAYPGSCSCGYTRAWKAWSAALGETK